MFLLATCKLKMKSLRYSLNFVLSVTSERWPLPLLPPKDPQFKLSTMTQQWRVVDYDERFGRLEIWIPYLPLQKQNISPFVLSGRLMISNIMYCSGISVKESYLQSLIHMFAFHYSEGVSMLNSELLRIHKLFRRLKRKGQSLK